MEQAQADIDARAEMLTYLVNHNKRSFDEVALVIREFKGREEAESFLEELFS
jgi:hypothetical protein